MNQKQMKKKSLLLSTITMAAGLLMSFNTASGSTGVSMDGKYVTDFKTYASEQAAAENLAAEIGSEGFVLLKNKNKALPLASHLKNVTLFGDGAYDTVYGGGGSGAGTVNSYQTQKTLVGSLEENGFSVNPAVKDYYANLDNLNTSDPNDSWASASGVKFADLVNNPNAMDTVKGSYQFYDDAAIIVFSREGSEGSDKSTTRYDNGKSGASYAGTAYEGKDGHSLELFPEELELIKHVEAQSFKKIIVLLNTSNAIEPAVLEDDDNIDSILWIGNPGAGGLGDIGKIFNGEINPSGKMVDVYDADHTQDPTWYNFGDLTQTGDNSGEGSIYYKDADGNTVEWAGASSGWGAGSPRQQIEYEEGIYVGYKWYETVNEKEGYYLEDENSYAPGTDRSAATKDKYYNRTNGVVYPFGFGLSYTHFDWEIVSSNAGALDAKTIVDIKVKVTNSGDVAGKDVVECYFTPDYYDGGIEKSAVNLISYAKTDLLDPGESQILDIAFNAKDMASFDYNDANGNGFKGYELEAGNYVVSLRSDSHTVKDSCSLTYTLTQKNGQGATGSKGSTGIIYDGSSAKYNWNEEGEVSTGKKSAEAVFSVDDENDPNNYWYTAHPKGTSASNVNYVTRADMKLPSAPTVETSILTQKDLDAVVYQENFTPADDKTTDPWYVTDSGIPSGWDQATVAASKADTIQISSLRGKMVSAKIENGEVKVEGDPADVAAWETFMNQFTLDELKSYLSLDWEVQSIDRAGIDKISANDGPAKLLNGTYWPCCTLIASTWNTDLAYKQGRLTGNEGLFQNCLGWYGPGANTHRSPFGGRNFEYYSSDGIQGGMICAAVIKGATDMGIIPTVKHCALNDQETHRQDNQGLVVWCNEQAMREIYLKPFEMSVTDGNGKAFMSSYTRFGTVGADNNYMFQNVVCREEWGMQGMFYSDMGGADNVDYHLRTGGTHGINSYSGQISGTWNAAEKSVDVTIDGQDVKSNTQYAAIRITAMQWMETGVNAANLRNLVDTEKFTSKTGTTFTATSGINFSGSVACSLEELNAYEASYAITDGALPQGVTLAEDGTLSGTPTEVGTFTFTVTLTADRYVTTVSKVNGRSDAKTGYYSTDATFTIVVNPCMKLADADWKVGEESEAQVTCDLLGDVSQYNSVTYSLTDAPSWMNIGEQDGAVYGTPDKAGTYTFSVKITTKTIDDSASSQTETTNEYVETFTITVADNEVAPAASKTITDVKSDDNGCTITFSDGTSVTITNGKDGAAGKDGTNGTNGTNGCGGSVIAATSSVAALGLAAVALALKKKREEK